MSDFNVHTLGCGSAKPTLQHLPSCTVVEHNGRLLMVDCGEGAQLSFIRQGLRPGRLTDIFLTHLHGDHLLGLPGLISSMGLSDMTNSLTIHTFPEGERIIRTMLDFFAPDLSLKLNFNIIGHENAMIADLGLLTVRTVALDHRVPCVGFIFEEKADRRHLLGEKANALGIPVADRRAITEGADWTAPDGTIHPNSELTTPSTPRSYAHIGDTRFIPGLGKRIGPVDLLFHETTYLDRDKEKAVKWNHSTASEAAAIAREAGAGALLTGHYSAAYSDINEFADEARRVFPHVILNNEGLVTPVRRKP